MVSGLVYYVCVVYTTRPHMHLTLSYQMLSQLGSGNMLLSTVQPLNTHNVHPRSNVL